VMRCQVVAQPEQPSESSTPMQAGLSGSAAQAAHSSRAMQPHQADLSLQPNQSSLAAQPASSGLAVLPTNGIWPGCLMDPSRDGSFRINAGLRTSRAMLLRVCQLGVPIACEVYDTITPQYISDLLSWAAVPAASATLRQLVSGLSMPAGLRCVSCNAAPGCTMTIQNPVKPQYLTQPIGCP
jgi:hypothetical protein